jgi:hypothetical protein
VILREHFRCAPEIISFSNLEFYSGSLIPLRLPTSSERLEPSLIDIRIANGTKAGKTNERECDRIVSEVKAIVTSSSHSKKRTIGIISLMGDEQSRLIRGRLLDAIGPIGFKEHEVLIGDPPTFQGAERDIVFLSLVCSPGSVPTQNQLMHAQRVNVALSRARDRMVLVRSIDANHIQNEQDVKFAVLDFFERAAHRTAGRLWDEAAVQHLVPPSSERSSLASSSVGAHAERVLKKLLQARGFSLRAMGDIWTGAICVENPSSGLRVGICVEGCGETQEEWSKLVDQQKSIERVGWECLRVSAISLVHDYYACIQSIVCFLNSVGVHPSTMEQVEADIEVVDMESDTEAEAPGVPQGVAPEVNEEGGIIVVSSDEESETEDSKPAAVKLPVAPGYSESLGNGEAAADYGNVVDLGFLRGSNPVNYFAPGVSMENAESRSDSGSSDRAYSSLHEPATERHARSGRSERNGASAHDAPRAIARRPCTSRHDSEEQDLESPSKKRRTITGRTIQAAETHYHMRGFDDGIVEGQQVGQNIGPVDNQVPDRVAATVPVYNTRAQGVSSSDRPDAASSRSTAGDQKRRLKRKLRTHRDNELSPSRPVRTVVQGGTESVDEDLSSSGDSDSDLDFVENGSTARSRVSRASKRSRRLNKYSRDGRWYPKSDDSDDEDHMVYEPLSADEITDEPREPRDDEGKRPSDQGQDNEEE